jgi:ABC-2 type transport system ATP-binding protein
MSGLDPMGRRAIREIILRLRDERKTIFFSSHVLGDVEQICDRVGILVKGRLMVQGRLDQLLTGNIEQVEIVASGLKDSAAAARIAAQCAATRISEAGTHFVVADLNTANAVVRAIVAEGGALVEFTPIKESLEDYFMRKQETPA